jgi:hypothetical protein
MTPPLATIDIGFLLPIWVVAPALICGVAVRRYSVLAVPIAGWLVTSVPAVVHSITTGEGNPVVLAGLWALYVAVPVSLLLLLGIAAGRLVLGPPGAPRN